MRREVPLEYFPSSLKVDGLTELDRRGWGSEEATQLILNNLLHMTATHYVQHHVEIAILWNTLASSRPTNLPIIVNYLFIMASLSPDTLLAHVG